MIAVDTNILVLAHRRGADRHAAALAWLRALAEGTTPWGLPVFCLGEFVRVVTHPRIFDRPSTLEESLGAIRTLLAGPAARLLVPGPRFPDLFSELVRSADARGNLAFDAQIAAVCIEHNARTLLTQDRDFARFEGLDAIGLDEPPPDPSGRRHASRRT